MKDPYLKTFEQIGDALVTLNKRIAELAKRTLTVMEYEDFVKEINETEKNNGKKIYDDKGAEEDA